MNHAKDVKSTMEEPFNFNQKEASKRTRGFLCETPIVGSFFPKESLGVVALPAMVKTPEHAQFRRSRFLSNTIMTEGYKKNR